MDESHEEEEEKKEKRKVEFVDPVTAATAVESLLMILNYESIVETVYSILSGYETMY